MLELVVGRGWSVRQTEDAVRKWVTQPSRDETERGRDPFLTSLEDRFQRALGTRVAIRQPAGADVGTVVIHYYSAEQLQAILERVIGEDLT